VIAMAKRGRPPKDEYVLDVEATVFELIRRGHKGKHGSIKALRQELEATNLKDKSLRTISNRLKRFKDNAHPQRKPRNDNKKSPP
jgi:hypothetical protein